MRRVLRSVLLVLVGLTVAGSLTACEGLVPRTPTPSPTPLPSPTSTATPIVVTLDTSSITIEPSWTPVPSRTVPPTRTRQPTRTLTFTPAATVTPAQFAGPVGVLTADNLFTVEIKRDVLLTELQAERQNALFSPTVGLVTKVTNGVDVMRVEVALNNGTQEGLRAELEFSLRPANDQVRVNLTTYDALNGGTLTPTQIAAVRGITGNALNRLLMNEINRTAITFQTLQVRTIIVEPERLLITVRLQVPPTLTPEVTATELPTETESPAPTVVPTDAVTEAAFTAAPTSVP